MTSASLERGNSYSLFFDLAKYSLWDYFEDSNVSITTLEQKRAVFSRTIGLAGALAYLHDELFLASTGEQLCCYHLDLKPHNILVFEDGGNITWKVSDFGISQIKRISASRTHSESSHPTSLLNKIFRPESVDYSSGVETPRDAGTYTAPEARHKMEKVTRASDVWSLGSVLTLVLAFMEDQRNGIKDFKDARMKGKEDDLFYDKSSPMYGTESRSSLRPSVRVRLDFLEENAKKRSKAEGEAVGMASDLIRNRMLLPNPRDRATAKQVESELRSIQTYFALGLTPSQAPRQQLHPLVETPHSNLFRLRELVRMGFTHKNTSTKTSRTWHFSVPESTRRCKFSHDGKYLGIESSEIITTSGILDVQRGIPGTTHSAPNQERWSDFSLGSDILCAGVDSDYFRVCFVLPCPAW